MNQNQIVEKLNKLLEISYAPYSAVKVSALIITKNNQLYSGINIENMSFTPSICAERCAIFKAISENEKPQNFLALHLKSTTKKPLYPCGVCLQVMNEFFNKDTTIFIYDKNNQLFDSKKVYELLPKPTTIDKDEFFLWK